MAKPGLFGYGRTPKCFWIDYYIENLTSPHHCVVNMINKKIMSKYEKGDITGSLKSMHENSHHALSHDNYRISRSMIHDSLQPKY